MSHKFSELIRELQPEPQTWLITGIAGFIGCNLAEALLQLGQRVVGLDNFATGYSANLDDIRRSTGAGTALQFVEGDICDLETCRRVCNGVDIVLHEAALGSVPRSIDDPLGSHAANVDGFLNMLIAARDAGVRRFVYAASSAAYGDLEVSPKVEDKIGRALSPYAVTKVINELYAGVFEDLYGIECIGLRYFNVFGPRQDPDGAYAAVIPRWIGKMIGQQTCEIYGDGSASRDFCFIDNVIEGNIRAGLVKGAGATGQIYNIACGERTDLNELYRLIRARVEYLEPSLRVPDVSHVPPRKGDIQHSLADVSKARRVLGYVGDVSVPDGLDRTVDWFLSKR